MANPPRTRKRVHAVRRAPDGSAFEKCENCGVLVAIALADMHECEAEPKKAVKRFKGLNGKQNIVEGCNSDQPRSPFRFFMEDFMNTCKKGKLIEIDREGFEIWKNMSKEERQPYVNKAQKVNSAYVKSLIQEVDYSSEVDEEVDSATVGKFDPLYEDDGCNDYSDSFDSLRRFESFNTWELEMVKPWITGKWSSQSLYLELDLNGQWCSEKKKGNGER